MSGFKGRKPFQPLQQNKNFLEPENLLTPSFINIHYIKHFYGKTKINCIYFLDFRINKKFRLLQGKRPAGEKLLQKK